MTDDNRDSIQMPRVDTALETDRDYVTTSRNLVQVDDSIKNDPRVAALFDDVPDNELVIGSAPSPDTASKLREVTEVPETEITSDSSTKDKKESGNQNVSLGSKLKWPIVCIALLAVAVIAIKLLVVDQFKSNAIEVDDSVDQHELNKA